MTNNPRNLLLCSYLMQPNRLAQTLCDHAVSHSSRLSIGVHDVAGARLLDFGIEAGRGGLEAGLLLARVCLADLAAVTLHATDTARDGGSVSVQIHTDHPLIACLGSQYAGWPVQVEKFFAMASGPMRMLRGREEMLVDFGLADATEPFAVGVLECDRLPSENVIETIADQCHVAPSKLTLCVAPVTSAAGSIQVVARSVETAMHKMHAIGLDPTKVTAGFGTAPLPPPATDTIEGIGRTNDAMLYGGEVTLWVDLPQDAIDSLGGQIPSNSSRDYGKPFAEIFKSYDYDFYKVDPQLFSPAVVTLINCRSGKRRSFGQRAIDILADSFGDVADPQRGSRD
jgi:methenyltetrahydromethanopterin cyclohydrolase